MSATSNMVRTLSKDIIVKVTRPQSLPMMCGAADLFRLILNMNNKSKTMRHFELYLENKRKRPKIIRVFQKVCGGAGIVVK